MIAFGALFTALTPFNSRELFQFSMQLFYEPTHLVLIFNNLRVDQTGGQLVITQSMLPFVATTLKSCTLNGTSLSLTAIPY